MLVTDLQQMEQIVFSQGDLEWEGWDVVKYTESPNALFTTDGTFRQGKWMKKKVFPLTEKGWHLPKSMGREYAQVSR
jgi:hypothetical protein